MNKLATVVLLVCFPIAFAVAQSRIEVAADKMFTLTLESNPSTGYQWELSQPLDETKLKLVDSFFEKPRSDRPGAVGVELWLFRAVGSGETTISMRYVRPWEKDAVPGETASFSVNIR
jgi:inhibitor of cysteine peptidase